MGFSFSNTFFVRLIIREQRIIYKTLALFLITFLNQWRIQRLIWAHREQEARVWENQLGVCKPPPAGTEQSLVGGRGAKPPENFDDLLVKITFLKLNTPFYET